MYTQWSRKLLGNSLQWHLYFICKTTHLVMFLTLAPNLYWQFLAKKCILLRWSTPRVPTVDMWISQISGLLPIEKLTHDFNHKSDTFWRIWEPLHTFLKKLWLLDTGKHWLIAPWTYTIYLCPSVSDVNLIIYRFLFLKIFIIFFCFLFFNLS